MVSSTRASAAPEPIDLKLGASGAIAIVSGLVPHDAVEPKSRCAPIPAARGGAVSGWTIDVSPRSAAPVSGRGARRTLNPLREIRLERNRAAAVPRRLELIVEGTQP